MIDPTSPRPSPPPRGGEGDEAKAGPDHSSPPRGGGEGRVRWGRVIDPTSPRPSPPPRGGEADEAKARASMGPARRVTVLSVAYPFAPVGPDAVGGAEQILSELDRML